MANDEPSPQEVAAAVYAFAAEQLKSGTSAPDVQRTLVAQGLNNEAAATVVDNLTRAMASELRGEASRSMLYGALWCIGGIIVTAVTYAVAAPGQTYVVAWGAIAVGGLQLVRGLDRRAGLSTAVPANPRRRAALVLLLIGLAIAFALVFG